MSSGTVSDLLYLTAVTMYVLEMSFDTTLFHIPWPKWYLPAMRIMACAAIFLKTGCTGAYVGKGWPACIFSFIAFKYSWLSTGYVFLLDTILLIMGAVGVPYKKILKAGFWTGLSVLLTAMTGSFTGCIKDLVYIDDSMFKHSFGICYPTDFAAHVVFLFLAGWVLYGKAHLLLSGICSTALSIFIYHYSGSRTSTTVLLLAAMGISYVGIIKWQSRSPVVKKCAIHADRVLKYALPCCAVLVAALTAYFASGSEMAGRVNALLSDRLRLAHTAMEKYGITLFGTPFVQRGFGGTTAWTWALEYTFVDSSYMLVLIRYGLMNLLAVCFLSVLACRKAVRYGHRELVMAAALLSVHSIMEHHLPELAYNIFLLLPFADFSDTDVGQQTDAFAVSGRKCFSYTAVLRVGIAMLIISALLPWFVPYMKTIVDILHLAEGQKHVIFCAIIAVCLLWVFLLYRLVCRLINRFVKREPLAEAKPLFFSVALLAVFCCCLIRGDRVMRQGQDEYGMLLEADAPAIEVLLAQTDAGRLYIGHVPELYRRKFPGISNTVMSGEGLAARKDTVLITDNQEELSVLMSAGYEYGELPSGHAVYTNNEKAIDVLEASGIPMEPYYSKITTVNLYDAALWNGLSVTDEGVLLLSGAGQSLLHGPWCTVYSGTLEIKYVLRLIHNDAGSDTVATASVVSDNGLCIWKRQDIHAADFSADGECICLLECSLEFNCPYMEFQLSAVDGVELELHQISYRKTK